MAANRVKTKRKPAALDGEDLYAVEAILDKKVDNGTEMYLVKWLGWSERWNSWEPRVNITTVELIDEFESGSGCGAGVAPKRRLSNSAALPYERKRAKKRGKKKSKHSPKNARAVVDEPPMTGVEHQQQSSIVDNSAETVVTIEDAMVIVGDDSSVQQQPQQQQQCITDDGAAVETVVCEEQNNIADNASIAESLESDVSVNSPLIPGIVPKINDEFSDYNSSQSSPESATNYETNCDDRSSGAIADSNRDEKINSVTQVVIERLPTPDYKRLITKQAVIDESEESSEISSAKSTVNSDSGECAITQTDSVNERVFEQQLPHQNEELVGVSPEPGVSGLREEESADGVLMEQSCGDKQSATQSLLPPVVVVSVPNIDLIPSDSAQSDANEKTTSSVVQIDSCNDSTKTTTDSLELPAGVPPVEQEVVANTTTAATLTISGALPQSERTNVDVLVGQKCVPIIDSANKENIDEEVILPNFSPISSADENLDTAVAIAVEKVLVDDSSTDDSNRRDLVANVELSKCDNITRSPINDEKEVECEELIDDGVVDADYEQIDSNDNLVINEDYSSDEKEIEKTEISGNIIKSKTNKKAKTGDKANIKDDFVEIESEEDFNDDSQQSQESISMPETPKWTPQSESIAKTLSTLSANTGQMDVINVNCNSKYETVLRLPSSPVSVRQFHPSSLSRAQTPISAPRPPSEPRHAESIETTFSTIVDVMLNTSESDSTHMNVSHSLPSIKSTSNDFSDNCKDADKTAQNIQFSAITTATTTASAVVHTLSSVQTPISSAPLVITQSVPQNLMVSQPSRLLPQPSSASMPSAAAQSLPTLPSAPSPYDPLVADASRLPLLSQTSMRPYHQSFMSNKVARVNPMQDTTMYNNNGNNGNNGMQSLIANDLRARAHIIAPHSVIMPTPPQSHPHMLHRQIAPTMHGMVNSNLRPDIAPIGSMRHLPASPSAIPRVERPSMMNNQKYFNPRSEPLNQIQLKPPPHRQVTNEHMQRHYAPIFMPPMRSVVTTTANALIPPSEPTIRTSQSSMPSLPPQRYMNEAPLHHYHPYHHNNAPHTEDQYRSSLQYNPLSTNRLPWPFPVSDAQFSGHNNNVSQRQQQLPPRFYAPHESMIQPSTGTTVANNQGSGRNTLASNASQQQIPAIHTPYSQEYQKRVIVEPKSADNIRDKIRHTYSPSMRMPSNGVQYHSNNYTNQKNSAADKDNPALYNKMGHNDNMSNIEFEVQKILEGKSLESGGNAVSLPSNREMSAAADGAVYRNRDTDEAKAKKHMRNSAFKSHILHQLLQPPVENTGFGHTPTRVNIDDTSFITLADKTQQQVMVTSDSFNQSTDWPTMRTSRPSSRTPSVSSSIGSSSLHHHKDLLEEALEQVQLFVVDDKDGYNDEDGEEIQLTITADEEELKTDDEQQQQEANVVMSEDGQCFYYIADENAAQLTGDALIDFIKSQGLEVVDEESIKNATEGEQEEETAVEISGENASNTFTVVGAEDTIVEAEDTIEQTSNDSIINEVQIDNNSVQSSPQSITTDNLLKNCQQLSDEHINSANDLNNTTEDELNGDITERQPISETNAEINTAVDTEVDKTDTVVDNSNSVTAVDTNINELLLQSSTVDSNTSDTVNDNNTDNATNNTTDNTSLDDSTKKLTTVNADDIAKDDNNTMEHELNGDINERQPISDRNGEVNHAIDTDVNKSAAEADNASGVTAVDTNMTELLLQSSTVDTTGISNTSDTVNDNNTNNTTDNTSLNSTKQLTPAVNADNVENDDNNDNDMCSASDDNVDKNKCNITSDNDKENGETVAQPIRYVSMPTFCFNETTTVSNTVANASVVEVEADVDVGGHQEDKVDTTTQRISDNTTETKKRGRKRKRKTKLVGVSSTPPKKRMSDDEVRELLHLLRTRKNGFDYGWTPSQILGINSLDNTLIFLVKWSNDRESMVLAEVANARCPQMVIQYYERHVYWDEFDVS